MVSRAAAFLAIGVMLAGCSQYSADHPSGDPDGGGVELPDGATSSGGDGPSTGTPPVRACTTSFTFDPGHPATTVGVAGEWNAWDPKMGALTGPDATGAFSGALTIPTGDHAYKLVVDGKDWVLDPANPYSKYVGGVENSLVEVEDCALPQLGFVKLDRTPDGTMSAQVQYVDGSGAAGIDPDKLEVLLDGAPVAGALTMMAPNGLLTIGASGLAKDKHRLAIHAADKAGHPARELTVPFWIEDQPFDFRDGLLYFAFTDRFRNGAPGNDALVSGVDGRANYLGGDYAGIQLAIESGYFDALGVRTLWLSPPNTNPDHGETGTGGHLYTGYHGYWPTSGREVQARFGGLPALKALVAAAHKRGLRVIVDTVLNHVHKDHPFWVQHKNDGWFNGTGGCVCGGTNCDWTQHALDCWFQDYLPDLDYTNYDAMKAMIDDALFWAREADVDGFRVDAVKHFLHAATRRLRSKLHDELEHVGPLFYLVGETFDGDRGLINSYVGPRELHAQFDFPIYFAVRDALASYSQTLRALETAVTDSKAAFGGAPMSPFLGNHDVPRFLSQAAGMLTSDPQGEAWSAPPAAPPDESAYWKLRLALTFVATQPGVPLLYYGDEYGLVGAGDPDNRRFMKWSGYTAWEQSTLDVAQKLGAARRELVALQRGGERTLWIDDELFADPRTSGAAAAVVVINRAFSPRTVQVPVPAGVPLPDGTVLKDRLGGPDVTVAGGQLPLVLPAHFSAVLAP